MMMMMREKGASSVRFVFRSREKREREIVASHLRRRQETELRISLKNAQSTEVKKKKKKNLAREPMK